MEGAREVQAQAGEVNRRCLETVDRRVVFRGSGADSSMKRILPRLARGAVAAAFLWLGGCAVKFDYPTVAEAPLTAAGYKVDIRSLYCSASGDAMAVGVTESLSNLEGVAFYSRDGGASWRQASLQPPAYGVPLSIVALRSGQEIDQIHLSGYRHGQHALSGILRQSTDPGPWWSTSDGGRSWHEQAPKLPLPATSVIFDRMPEIVAADQAGTLVTAVDDRGRIVVLRSTDGGENWIRQSFPGLAHYGSIVSDGKGRLILTGRSNGDRGVIYRSVDAGATWSEGEFASRNAFPFALPRALRLYQSPVGSLIAFNNDAIGKGKSPAWLFVSTDGGQSWRFVRSFERLGQVVGIAGDGTGRIVAVTAWGSVLISDNGGLNWRQGASPNIAKTELSVSNVIVAQDGRVVATLDRATIIRSDDQGETWRVVDSQLPDRQFVLGTYCQDGKGSIVVAGSGGMLSRSIDWGLTWQRGYVVGTIAPSQ